MNVVCKGLHFLVLGLFLAGCHRVTAKNFSGDFNRAFAIPFPASFSIVDSHRSAPDHFGDYDLDAEVLLSHEDYQKLKQQCGQMEMFPVSGSLEVIRKRELVEVFRSSSASYQVIKPGCLARIAFMPDKQTVVVLIERY